MTAVGFIFIILALIIAGHREYGEKPRTIEMGLVISGFLLIIIGVAVALWKYMP